MSVRFIVVDVGDSPASGALTIHTTYLHYRRRGLSLPEQDSTLVNTVTALLYRNYLIV